MGNKGRCKIVILLTRGLALIPIYAHDPIFGIEKYTHTISAIINIWASQLVITHQGQFLFFVKRETRVAPLEDSPVLSPEHGSCHFFDSMTFTKVSLETCEHFYTRFLSKIKI